MIKDNISSIKEQISNICNKLGVNPKEVVLVGVTKYSEVSDIKEAINCGINNIGENRVQDALSKFSALEGQGISFTKHMIGHLQTNKVKKAIEVFDIIQSVDSLKLAQEIEKQAQKINKIINILVQVNTSGEEQKFGIEKEAGLSLVEGISLLKNINILGLMTIAPLTDNKEIVRNCFRDLRSLRDEVNAKLKGKPNLEMKYLSMGMTDDFEIALEEGSNMLRIGRAIFK